MNRIPCQVVKLGGSLLDDRRLVDQWRRWWNASEAVATVLVVGGGAPVETLRAEQLARGLSDIEAHWLAIRAMGDNAREFAKILELDERRHVVTRVAELSARVQTQPLTVVDPLDLFQYDEPTAAGTPLPCSWDVTSDSIAARVAQLLDCPMLTLLKSALPGEAATYSAAAQSGYVDRFFPTAASWLDSVRCFNLRSNQLERQVLVRERPRDAIDKTELVY